MTDMISAEQPLQRALRALCANLLLIMAGNARRAEHLPTQIDAVREAIAAYKTETETGYKTENDARLANMLRGMLHIDYLERQAREARFTPKAEQERQHKDGSFLEQRVLAFMRSAALESAARFFGSNTRGDWWQDFHNAMRLYKQAREQAEQYEREHPERDPVLFLDLLTEPQVQALRFLALPQAKQAQQRRGPYKGTLKALARDDLIEPDGDGHRLTAKGHKALAYFAEKDGWEKARSA